MDKKSYQQPQLERLGSVHELTQGTSEPPTCSSALGEDFSSQDALCEIQDP